jgi:hypothetical protein
MAKQSVDWHDYQILPGPAGAARAVDSSNGGVHGLPAGQGNEAPTNPLEVRPLGGGYRIRWRRVLNLGVGLLATFCLAVGLSIPWSIKWNGIPGEQIESSYWNEHPVACVAVGVVVATSLILLCAQRASCTIAVLNCFAFLVIVGTLAYTQNYNSGLTSPRVQYMTGFSSIAMLLGTVLNIVSSIIQPSAEE